MNNVDDPDGARKTCCTYAMLIRGEWNRVIEYGKGKNNNQNPNWVRKLKLNICYW